MPRKVTLRYPCLGLVVLAVGLAAGLVWAACALPGAAAPLGVGSGRCGPLGVLAASGYGFAQAGVAPHPLRDAAASAGVLADSQIAFLPAGGLGVVLEMGQETTESLILSNAGSEDLTFELVELPSEFMPVSGTQAGGPDPFGYIYEDSSQIGGAILSWIDASDGTSLGLVDDGEANVTLPFPFDFYGTTYGSLRVGNNGGVILGAAGADLPYANAALDATGLDNLIAPFWDDLDDENGNVYYKVVGSAPDRHMVIEWHQRPHYNGTGAATFELILDEGTNNVKFQYQDVEFGNVSVDDGASATVGLRRDAASFLQYSYNAPVLSSGLAICFQYPGSPPCDVLDAAWLSVDPVSGTVAPGSSLPLAVTFDGDRVEQPGRYATRLRFYSNAADAQPYVDYPVTMTVQPVASWGKLQGKVTDARDGAGLADAHVRVVSESSTYKTLTAGDGGYSHWMPAGVYTVAVGASGYLTDAQSISAIAGVTVVHDVALVQSVPQVVASPLVLTITQDAGAIATRPLSLRNMGGADLTFRLIEFSRALPVQSAGTSSQALLGGPVGVDPAVEETLSREGRADFWVVLDGQPDLSPAFGMGWRERGEYVYDTLRQLAARSQAQVRAYLDQAGVSYRAHWIVNAIHVRGGSAATLEAISQMDRVLRVRAPVALPVPEPVEKQDQLVAAMAPTAAEWGLNMIHAPDVWAHYGRGEGIVVANLDTGVRYTHQALVGQYRGNRGDGTFDHDFNWYDPQGGTAPADDHGHGSHTMGTMVGDDGAGNLIGVAPGARWIAADGCDGTNCPDADLISSAEWLLAPCPQGAAPGSGSCDPALRPQVINNSWGDCDTTISSFFEAPIDAWRAAGIYVVFSAGNTGNCSYAAPFCGSLGNPARHYQVTSVGATMATDEIAPFSLWGPSDDPDPRLGAYAGIKPEVVAPGALIRSSLNGSDTAYGAWSGTSMAAPHVAGVVALMLSVNPGLIGQSDQIEDILKDTADPKPYATGCSEEGPASMPNNAFGWGRVNALGAVEEALALSDIPWLSTDPVSGTIPAGDALTVEVRFDALGLGPGEYAGTLLVQHNDPYMDSVRIPVTMTVPMPPPALHVTRVLPSQVEAGTLLTWTVVVRNDGGDASGVVVSDTVPAHTSFARASEGGGVAGSDVVWNGLQVEASESVTLTCAVTVSCVASGTQIVQGPPLVYAAEWPTPTYGVPSAVTVVEEGISARFDIPSFLLVGWPVTLTNRSVNATSYVWTFGDGASSTQASPAHVYGAVGTYEVRLWVSNLCQAAEAAHSLQVGELGVTISPGVAELSGDPGQEVTYTLRVDNVGTLSERFVLRVEGASWPVALSTDELVLDAGQNAVVTAWVALPVGTPAGQRDSARVEVRAATDPRPSPETAVAVLTTTAIADTRRSFLPWIARR
jgi:uncharacterized repeat protein (TIGR01451 family)